VQLVSSSTLWHRADFNLDTCLLKALDICTTESSWRQEATADLFGERLVAEKGNGCFCCEDTSQVVESALKSEATESPLW